jgi:cation transport regulator
MPYHSTSELADKIKNNLPEHAQKIYLEAFNHAWDEYKSPKNRRSGSQEEVSHKVAWAAVKKKYEKGSDDKWHPKN